MDPEWNVGSFARKKHGFFLLSLLVMRTSPVHSSWLRFLRSDLRQLFDMIDGTGEGEIQSAEFIAALSRWVRDSKTAPRFVKYNMLRCRLRRRPDRLGRVVSGQPKGPEVSRRPARWGVGGRLALW